MGELSYREYHEAYLSNHEGTSILELLIFFATVLSIGFHSLYLRCRVNFETSLSIFVVDVLTFVFPCIALMTVLHSHVLFCFCIAAPSSLIISIYELFIRSSKTPLSSLLSIDIPTKRRSFVTYFKSVVSLLTIICILAVDFTVFPPQQIKTEKFGFSLMDTGVGFYIVSNGLTLNVLRVENLVKKSFMSNVPLLILGLVRYATVEKIDYQKHVTEYGIHWNFFFTLAFVKFIGAFLIAKMPRRTIFLSVAVLAAHHAILEAGISDWVLSDAPRNDILSANREGIVSIPGYLSLYLAAVSLGNWLVFNRENSSSLQEELVKGLKMAMLGASGLSLVATFNNIYPVSRRLANPTFTVWMMALCLLLIGVALILEDIIILISRNRNIVISVCETVLTLEAISANNLLFFLLGNLLTGAVNLSISTLLVPKLYSFIIIITYTVTCCGVVTSLFLKKWSLKFW